MARHPSPVRGGAHQFYEGGSHAGEATPAADNPLEVP